MENEDFFGFSTIDIDDSDPNAGDFEMGGTGFFGALVVSGIATIGVGTTTTPPSNSQLSFELPNNNTLRIKVRGTDGIIRVGIITIS